MQPGPLNPASLPPGAQVGPWRIVDRRGSGTYGAVFLAEGASGRVALKVAHDPRSARFGREAELLSRIRHPAVPRLIGHGQWVSPMGQPHPWLAMELLEGIPLYEWAGAFSPSSRQVLRVLARLARALEATHSVGGVHRDVKGDNVLVRPSDGQGYLIDFGSGTYRGAAPMTPPVFPPGTPPYRSPEAYRFALHILEQPVKVYAPGPADDVFALGVTSYKLVTGEYPPCPEPLDPRFHVWRTDGPGPLPAHALNARCGEELSLVISRMLSRQPEARGTARELARALERAARKSGPQADVPLFPGGARHSEVPHRNGWAWLAAAGFAGAMAALWAAEMPAQMQRVEREDARDAGTAAVGDSVLTASAASPHAPSAETSLSLDMPDKPLPGQLRPDASGRCRFKPQVPINGGCWLKVDMDLKDCKASTYSFVYKGACYQAGTEPTRPPTSAPTESLDGG
ncbi:MAG TPA: serine/threonine-protein kinase [Myxococcus sp.]|nr:serine/threonine-protein kinase [Myxococcus sp.]